MLINKLFFSDPVVSPRSLITFYKLRLHIASKVIIIKTRTMTTVSDSSLRSYCINSSESFSSWDGTQRPHLSQAGILPLGHILSLCGSLLLSNMHARALTHTHTSAKFKTQCE